MIKFLNIDLIVGLILLVAGLWFLWGCWSSEYYSPKISFRSMIDLPHITAMDWSGPDIAYATVKEGFIYKLDMRNKEYVKNPRSDIKKIVDVFFSDDGMEMGLLGIALAPSFQEDRKMYISYTALNDDISSENPDETLMKVMEVTLRPEGLESGRIIFNQLYSEKIHHAGTLVFSPEGELFLSSGDGGPQGDPNKVAQTLKGDNKYRGKIIKLDLSGRGNHKIVALGLRNPWKISINKEGLLIGDVGYNTKERLYLMPSSDPVVPYNFGWPYYEGTVRRLKTKSDSSRFEMPQFEYNTSDKYGRSVLGGYFWKGNVITADYLGHVRVLDVNANSSKIPWKEISLTMSPQKLWTLSKDPYTDSLYVAGEKGVDRLILL